MQVAGLRRSTPLRAAQALRWEQRLAHVGFGGAAGPRNRRCAYPSLGPLGAAALGRLGQQGRAALLLAVAPTLRSVLKRRRSALQPAGRAAKASLAASAEDMHTSSSESPLTPCEQGVAGNVFLYDNQWGLAAFEAGGLGQGESALVCVPGLTDGLLSQRYFPALAKELEPRGWRLVQPLLSSSYRGWGQGSLDEDCDELDRLLGFLQAHRGITKVALLGHSTGCQDVVRYLRVGRHAKQVCGAVLQAPVSDREALEAAGADREEVQKYRDMADEMIADARGNEAMPCAAALLLGPPHLVTAYRFASLAGRMTDDDMFSSDLTDDELKEKLGHVAVPTLIAASLDDEYVPESVDAKAHAARMAAAMAADSLGLVKEFFSQEGGHGLSAPLSAGGEFAAAVGDFLGSLEDGGPRLTWEVRVAADLLERSEAMAPGRPLMVALAGMPGSGKTTACTALERLLGPSCLVVPMDGFHVPLEQLRSRPDASEAIYRRGAPDTFDPKALLGCLAKIQQADGPAAVALPSFDHAVGDPVAGDVRFERARHRVVLVEGLYLLHEGDGWGGMAEIFDRRIYLDNAIEVCIARVKERNKAIPGYTAEEIEVRCERVDRANAIIVQASSARADEVVSNGGA